jgi:hypothetical protein
MIFMVRKICILIILTEENGNEEINRIFTNRGNGVITFF